MTERRILETVARADLIVCRARASPWVWLIVAAMAAAILILIITRR